MMNMANMHDKLVKKGWFKTTIRLAAPVFYTGATSSVPKGDRDLKIDLGGNDKATYNLITPTKRFSQPTKSRGNVGKTNIQDCLLKLGWFKKTDEAVVHGPQSNGKVDLVPEGASNLDLWLKNYHEGKLRETSEATSTVGDDIVEILDWIRRKEETVLPGKRQQGMVDKEEFRKNLLSKGWYSATDNLRVETNTPADVSPEGVGPTTHVNTGIDIGPNDSRKLCDDIYGKPEGIEQILNMVSTKKRLSQPAKSRGKVTKAELQENLLVKGWYRLTPKSDEDTSTVPNSDCSQDENIDDLEGKTVDKKEIIISSEGKTVDKNEIKQGDAEVQPSQFSLKETIVDRPAKNNGNILLDGQRKRRHTSECKYGDKRSKKAKLNEKDINNLLQESWTMVTRSRYQVTLVKLPEREPPKACITDTLSKSSGIKNDMQAIRTVQSENGDVETNVTDLSNNTTSLRRFLRRSRKMLRKMFTCGRNEE